MNVYQYVLTDMKRKNDENCVVANMFTVFWFNKQNEFEINFGDAFWLLFCQEYIFQNCLQS